MHTYRITGICPLEDSPLRFSPEAVAGMIGTTVTMHHNFRWDDPIGKVTVEGASLDGTDLRLTVTYDEATDKRLREHGYGRKALKALSIGGVRVETSADDENLCTVFDLREVCPRIEPPGAPRMASRP